MKHVLPRTFFDLLVPRHSGRPSLDSPRRANGREGNPVRVLFRRAAIETRLARLNWTKSELAARAGISRGHLSDLLAGRKQPRPELRVRLLAELCATFDELFEITPVAIDQDGKVAEVIPSDGKVTA